MSDINARLNRLDKRQAETSEMMHKEEKGWARLARDMAATRRSYERLMAEEPKREETR